MMVFSHVGLFSPVYQDPAGITGQRSILMERVKEVFGHGFSGFDFYGYAVGAEINDEIHFQSPPVPPEIKGRPFPMMEEDFLDFIYDKILENSAPQWMVPQVFRPSNPQ
jgi:hypothetical protein